MKAKELKSLCFVLTLIAIFWFVGDQIIAPRWETYANPEPITAIVQQDQDVKTTDDPCAAYLLYKEYVDLYEHYKKIGGIPEAGILIEKTTTDSAEKAFTALYQRMVGGTALECGVDYDVIETIIWAIYNTGKPTYQKLYDDPVIRRAYLASLKALVARGDMKSEAFTLKVSNPPWSFRIEELK